MRTLIQINQRQGFDSAVAFLSVILSFVIPEGNLLLPVSLSSSTPRQRPDAMTPDVLDTWTRPSVI
jgi:hypothetical protein